MTPTVHSLGPNAAVIELAQEISEAAWVRVQRLTACLNKNPPAGVRETVPAYTSVTAHFDNSEEAASLVHDWLQSHPEKDWPQWEGNADGVCELPVYYGGDCGPDLERVAGQLKLSPDKVVEIHAQSTYRVYMTGFSPGFAFMGPLDKALQLARRATPRPRVSPGSVAIAGGQTGVYPCATPGGWHLIGQTPVKLFDPLRDNPFLLTAGIFEFCRRIACASGSGQSLHLPAGWIWRLAGPAPAQGRPSAPE